MGTAAVLIVEDEPLICELLVDALQDEGVAAECAGSYDEAVTALASDCGFKVLVTDVHLGPGADGFAVALRAREVRPEIFVLYVTGHAAAEVASKGVDRAMVVPKPYLPLQLAGQIAALARVAGTFE